MGLHLPVRFGLSGLLALLDDVAALAKVAATSLDDIAMTAATSVDDVAMAALDAGSKTAGVVIDDAAVTPKYVHGFAPARELPIIWKIARGSLLNKMLILLPAALALAHFAPWAVTPLLMLGGSYLCFEGAEKIFHVFFPHGDKHIEAAMTVKDPGHLEEQKVKGAIKTDFILSAEIMTIALSSIPDSTIWIEASALALVGIGITAIVYGSVALIVKMDDVGLYLAKNESSELVRSLGRALVKGMPMLMTFLSVVGTGAMLWVGGSIMVHGLHDLGMHHPYEDIHHLAEVAAHSVPHALEGTASWAVTAFCDGVLGLLYGLLLIPVVTRGLIPVVEAVRGESASH